MAIWHCHSGEQAATKMYLPLKLIVDIFPVFPDHWNIYREERNKTGRKRGTVSKWRQILLQTSFRGYLVSLVKYSLSNLTSKSLFAP